jgi:hypothetical protein
MEVVIGLQIGQDLEAGAARQVQVEQDQPRPGHAGVVAGAAQELDGLFAIADHVQGVVRPVVREGLLGEEDVPRVVFDQEDVDRVERGSVGHRGSWSSVGADSVKQSYRPARFLSAAGRVAVEQAWLWPGRRRRGQQRGWPAALP